MDADNRQYLENYYESQSSFSYLNSEKYYKDLKKLLDEPTKVRASKLKTKIIKTLDLDIKKVEKKNANSESKQIEDFFKLMVLKIIRGFFK